MSRNIAIISITVFIVLAALFYRFNDDGSLLGGYGRKINGLIEKNVAAKGGEQVWHNVSSLQLSGMMDLGQGMVVPYRIDQKRPLKMCLEYEFDERRVVQCVDGDSGWEFLPFLGRNLPEKMTDEEALKMADTASIDGLLLSASKRGFGIEWVGKEDVNGRPADRLKVTMPGGSVRWISLDEETGLELKVGYTRVVRGKEQMVESLFSDWKSEAGLLFPGRTDTRMIGSSGSQFVTVDKIVVNPEIEDKRFEMPIFSNTAASS